MMVNNELKTPNISEDLLSEIQNFAKEANLEKVVLFGSRAKKNNYKTSDIDLAVYGGDFDRFYWSIEEEINSLLSFDIIDMNNYVSEDLCNEIKQDGVVIYEKI